MGSTQDYGSNVNQQWISYRSNSETFIKTLTQRHDGTYIKMLRSVSKISSGPFFIIQSKHRTCSKRAFGLGNLS